MNNEIKNIPASVKARLKNKAKEINTEFAEMLKNYCMERFIYRIGISRHADRFVLKGALMFAVWRIPERRTTLDIDLLACLENSPAAIEKAIKEVCVMKEDDGLIFDPESVKCGAIKIDSDYEGVRAKFTGFLERSKIPMQIDFGFGDIVYPGPVCIDYPVLLDFPAPRLKGYTVESVVAEKFEAMVKLGALNSRMKDFYDVWLLIKKPAFKPDELATAIKKTFEHRKTALPEGKKFFAEEIYDEGSDRQKLWQAFLRKNGIKIAPDKLSTVAEDIEAFLSGPVERIRKER